MRAAFWFIALFGVAVAVALFAGDNDAVVSLFWAPHRVDISLNLMVLLLFAAFALLHFALKALSVIASLPVQARRWRICWPGASYVPHARPKTPCRKKKA